MSIHVSPTLDQDQRICRRGSFYDLVELMTFGRLSFTQSPSIPWVSLPALADQTIAGTAVTDRSGTRHHSAIGASSASGVVAYQSWALLDHDQTIDWGCADASAPSIYIVSTIRALAESLLVSEDLQVSIDRTSRLVYLPTQEEPARPTPAPVFDDGTLTVTLWPRQRSERQRSTLRLPVDLKTLLASVLIAPQAPTRFVELVSDVVQRVTRAKVIHASEPFAFAETRGVYARRA